MSESRPRESVTRSEAIAAAIRKELVSRRAHLDAAQDLGEVTVVVKLNAGTSWVRGVVWQEERTCRSGRTT